jgi:hypothetical protein
VFEEFKKIPRLFRDCTISEKIDGTNGQILIQDVLEAQWSPTGTPAERWQDPLVTIERGDRRYHVWAGSRNRFVYPGKGTDNSGFAAWVLSNVEDLFDILGPGRHFGEWWGQGINRGYGLKEKRFSLFNPKWDDVLKDRTLGAGLPVPPGLGTVPVLYVGPFKTAEVEDCLFLLRTFGSRAVPDFMDPEGVVVYHHASGHYYKTTIKDDEKPKGSTEKAY